MVVMYGRGLLNGGGYIYRGHPGPPVAFPTLSQPDRKAVTVRIYDSSDLLQNILSSNVQNCPILGLSWELLDIGCGAFDMELSEDLGLKHGWRVDIHLWNRPYPIYSGIVRELPGAGSTEQTFEYGGFGPVGAFEKAYLTATYTPKPLREIVLDVIGKFDRQLRYQIASSEVAPISYLPSGDLRWVRVPLKQALQSLANLAGGFVWGVDARRRFFFRPPSEAIDVHSWVGRHLDTYVPKEDTTQLVNRLFVKSGLVRGAGEFVKTNWCDIPVDNLSSQALYGLSEGTHDASALTSQLDAYRSAGTDLAKRSRPSQKASVSGLSYNGEEISAAGQARIVGRGGRELILPKKRLRFALKAGRVEVRLDLGDQLPDTPATWIAAVSSKIEAEAIARQQSQSQL